MAGYTPKANLERRLAYNYSLLSDTKSMIKVLSYLLQSEDVTIDDFAVAISVALDNGEIERAKSWAQEALARFPESDIIRPLLITAYRMNGEANLAKDMFATIPEKNMIENPNYLLEKAILLYDDGDISAAKKLFRDLSQLDDWPDIAGDA